MSLPGFVIVSEESEDVHTAVIDESGNQKVVSLEEAVHYKQISVPRVPIVKPNSNKGFSGLKETDSKSVYRGDASKSDTKNTADKLKELPVPVEEDGALQQIVLDRIKTAEEKRREELEALVIKDQTVLSSVASELKTLETAVIPKKPRATPQRKHACDQCHKSFATPSMLLRHQSVHTGLKPYPCPRCSKSYTQPEHLQRHIRTVHVDDITTTLTARKKPLWHVCKACGQRFTAKYRYVEHLKVHLNGLFECHLCDRKFAIRNSLLRHIKSHSGEKNLKCDLCSKRFGSNQTLRNHLRIHAGSYPYKCSICEKGFSKKSRLLEHVEKHFEDNDSSEKAEKNYGCSNCGNIFTNVSDLEEHHAKNCPQKISVGKQMNSSSQTPYTENADDDMLPFHCNSCLFSFKECSELTKHCQIFHKCIVTNSKGQARFSCDPCEKFFDCREKLHDHLKLHDSSGALINPPANPELPQVYRLVQYYDIQNDLEIPQNNNISNLVNLQPNNNNNVGSIQFVHQESVAAELKDSLNSMTSEMAGLQPTHQTIQGTTGTFIPPKIKSSHPSQTTGYNRSLLTGLLEPAVKPAQSEGQSSAQVETDIFYQVDPEGHLYGIAGNGTVYQVVAADVPTTNDSSHWPPTEQQMESGDLLLDIVSQGGTTCLNITHDTEKSDLTPVQFTVLDRPSNNGDSKLVQLLNR